MCMNYKIVIIGGGASALMLASLLPENTVTILESNAKLGAKILVSGGGKCNITNEKMGTKYFVGDETFIGSILKNFNEKALILWLKKQGLRVIIRKETQYFCENSSKDLLNIFNNKLKKQKVLLNEKVLSLTKRDSFFSIKTNKRILTSDYVVIASGGLSFPVLGASSIGYEIAKFFGHKIIKTAPSLVGFTVQKEQFFFKELSGTSTDVSIKVEDNICNGALLFTHKGLSGPAVLDASLYWNKGKIEINFLVNFLWESIKGSKKQISSVLPLSKRITKAFLLQLGLKDKSFAQVSPEELEKLKTLNHYIFAPAGTFGYTKAEVTKGGVDISEIDVKTMMSKKTKNLYFVGEVLDVTGRLGGYNFQWAFSSAYTCVQSLLKDKREN